MSVQLNFLDTLSGISSPVEESGVTPSDSPDGKILAQWSPDHAHANLSPRQAKEKDLLMSGTFGRRSTGTMGLPIAWDVCACTAMQLLRLKRRRSSKAVLKNSESAG